MRRFHQQLFQLGYAWLITQAGIVAGWTSSSLSADLAWPPIDNEGYITKYGGQRVTPDPDTAAFPCASIDPPASQGSRHEFPLTGARLQINLLNSSSQYADYNFIVDTYLGQFSNDVSSNHSSWAYLSTYSYSDFASGSQCTDTINVTNEVITTPNFDLQLSSTDGANLNGVEVTLGLRTVLFKDSDNQEEMYQCSYLKLVAEGSFANQAGGTCNGAPSGGGGASSAVSEPTSTAISSASSSSKSTAAPTTDVGTGSTPVSNENKHSHQAIVGIAVGVSVGVAAMFVAFGIFLLRFRKATKSKGTMALGFWVAGGDDDPHEPDEKKERADIVIGEDKKISHHNMLRQGEEGGTKKMFGCDEGRKKSEVTTNTSKESMVSEPLPAYREP